MRSGIAEKTAQTSGWSSFAPVARTPMKFAMEFIDLRSKGRSASAYMEGLEPKFLMVEKV